MDAREHLVDAERLGDVVIRAGLESGHGVAQPGAGGQDHDRHLVSPSPELGEHGQTILARQTEVEHEEVEGVRVGAREGSVAILGDLGGKAVSVELLGKQGRYPRLVLRDQDASAGSPALDSIVRHGCSIRDAPRAVLHVATHSHARVDNGRTAHQEPEPMPDADRPRITVINDNPDFLELMAAILDEDAGYEVTLLDGERTSVDEIAASDPRLLIVDLLLGGASGWELVALARSDSRLADTPIVVCSGDVTSLRDRAEELARIGDVHVLEKPFGIDEVTELVERLIGGAQPVGG